MTPAAHPHGGKTGLHGGLALRGGTPARTAIRLEPVPQQPVAHRPLLRPTVSASSAIVMPAPMSRSSSSRGSPPRAAWASRLTASSPLFLHPVRNRRFVPPEPLADLGQRQSAAQELLERSAIHGRI